jgi:hypothetical protein
VATRSTDDEEHPMTDHPDDVEALDSEPDAEARRGDSADEVAQTDHDITNPSNNLPEEEVNDLLGGSFPLR